MSNELTTSSFDLSKPQQSLMVAETLQKFVKEKKLTSNIKGKEYPQVEAWQFAGSQLGLYPLLVEVKELSTDSEVKFSALVEVRRFSDDKIMSRGFATCSNKEATKKYFDEYAICSMAQTRAEGKAFRMLLSWLMKAAGFEATPAEEMDFSREEPPLDFITDQQKDELYQLLESSTYDETQRTQLRARIAIYDKFEQYDKAKANLLANQLGIEGATNPSQREISKHLKKAIA